MMIRGQHIIAITLMVVGGCSKLQTDYGQTRGRSADRSLNGLGTFRRAIVGENDDVDARDFTTLRERIEAVDAIVWTPVRHTPIAAETRQWFEGWLGLGNRTLVYVIADRGSMETYLRDLRDQAPPEMRMQYRRLHAREVAERMIARSGRSRISSPWFDIETVALTAAPMTGPWADPTSPMMVEHQQAIRIRNADQTSASPPDPIAGSEIESRSLLVADKDVIVGELTSPNWPGSKIIVIGGGSTVTNLAMTKPSGQWLAKRVAETLRRHQSNFSIAFSTTATSVLPVRESPADKPVSSGMEVLTTWPLSLVTTHGLIMAVVACLILIPILGRPRRMKSAEQTRFADHIDAVAALMMRTGGESFARRRIDQYRSGVRGESLPQNKHP